MKKLSKSFVQMLLLILLAMGIAGCGNTDKTIVNTDLSLESEILEVHFMDVGQGDASLIVFPSGKIALIDGGGRSASEKLVSYIEDQGISKIDYLIATHPHEDHIGGLPKVVDNFDIGSVYMPKLTANTKIFESLLESIKKKGLKINTVNGYMDILKEENIEFMTLAPLAKSYEDTNNHSIVNRLVYGSVGVIFTGDIEKEAEKDLLKSGYDLESDIIKVPHHGSSTSSSEEFLDKVNAKYAVIQLEKDNSYGHPHREVLKRLEDRNIDVLRNDTAGDIVMRSDGVNIEFPSLIENSSTDGGVGLDEIKEGVIGNRNTKVYHLEDCESLPSEKNRIYFDSREKAEESGFRPDSRCTR